MEREEEVKRRLCKDHFAGGKTYEDPTSVLQLISEECALCGRGMLMICLERKCGQVFCWECDCTHLCHQAIELQMALMDQILRVARRDSPFSQIEFINRKQRNLSSLLRAGLWAILRILHRGDRYLGKARVLRQAISGVTGSSLVFWSREISISERSVGFESRYPNCFHFLRQENARTVRPIRPVRVLRAIQLGFRSIYASDYELPKIQIRKAYASGGL